MTTKWKVFVAHQPWERDSALVVVGECSTGRRRFLAPAVVTEMDPGAVPTIDEVTWLKSFHDDDVKAMLQAMLNAAWEIGLRPPQFEQPANELRAVKAHLADTRAILNSKLEMGLPT